MAAQKFIQGAIRRPGALTAAVGGKPSRHMAAVRRLAASGTTQQKREADFYLNVLKPSSNAAKVATRLKGGSK